MYQHLDCYAVSADRMTFQRGCFELPHSAEAPEEDGRQMFEAPYDQK